MSEELAKVPAAGPLALPDHLKGLTGHEGFGNMEREDVVLPRLSICQAMSPQRKKTSANFIAGLNDGDLFNSVSSEVYGDSLLIIPLIFGKSRIYFRGLNEGGGILCQSLNGKDGGVISPTCDACPNSKFSGDGKAPACNLFYNYPVISLPRRELLVLSLKSTGLKVAKQWNSRMQLFNKPMYVGVYELRIVEQSNPKGTYFSPVISFKRFVDAEELGLAAKTYENLRGKEVRVDETGLDEHEDIPF